MGVALTPNDHTATRSLPERESSVGARLICLPGSTSKKVKYQKASTQKFIVGGKMITTSNIALYYNGGGDSMCEKKLDYALSVIRKNKATACVQ